MRAEELVILPTQFGPERWLVCRKLPGCPTTVVTDCPTRETALEEMRRLADSQAKQLQRTNGKGQVLLDFG